MDAASGLTAILRDARESALLGMRDESGNGFSDNGDVTIGAVDLH
jgi:hypothetical protein